MTASVSIRHQYAVIDLDKSSPLPSPTLTPASLGGKMSVVGSRNPHLSSNSHLSSFSGDSDTGSSCSSANPYHRLYSLSAAGAANRSSSSGKSVGDGGSVSRGGSGSGGDSREAGGSEAMSGDKTPGFLHRTGFRFSKTRRFLSPNSFATDTA